MISIDSLIKKLRAESFKSAHDQFTLVAAIFDKKNIVSIGTNKQLSWRRSVLPKFKKWPTSIHAEVDCIYKAKSDLKDKKLIVLRFLKDGSLAMSKPCNYCMAYINYVGIKEIIYSTSECKIESIKL